MLPNGDARLPTGGDLLLYVTFTAADCQTFALSVNRSDSIRDAKERIQNEWAILAHQQSLFNEKGSVDNDRRFCQITTGWKCCLGLQCFHEGWFESFKWLKRRVNFVNVSVRCSVSLLTSSDHQTRK